MIGCRDRVLIVGGGPAGLHAAWLLQQRGVGDVTVLEAAPRVGGRAHTVHVDGVQAELGACFLHNGYHEVRRLVRELDAPSSVPRPGGSAFFAEPFVKPERCGRARVLLELYRFVRLRRQWLRPSGQGLIAPPSPDVLALLSRPAAEVLGELGFLPTLEGCLRAAHSAQGYGWLERVPLLYVLLWMEPAFLAALVGSMVAWPLQKRVPSLRDRWGVTHLLPEGFGGLMERLASRLDADIQLGARVAEVDRDADCVSVTYVQQGQERRVHADWLVWTASAQALARVARRPTRLEAELEPHWVSSTLVSTLYTDESVPRYTGTGRPIAYFLDRAKPGNDRRWFGDRADGCLFSGQDPRARQHRVAYQYADSPATAPENAPSAFEDALCRYLSDAGRTQARLVRRGGHVVQGHHAYHPRLDAGGIRRGAHWELLAHQGAARTFRLGASLWFDSVEHVLRYNRAVLAA